MGKKEGGGLERAAECSIKIGKSGDIREMKRIEVFLE